MQQKGIWEKVREIEEARAAQANAIAEVQRLAEQERQRERDLVTEAENWEAAQTIRRYLSELGPATSDAGSEWLTWARAVVDQLDPFINRRVFLQAVPATPTEPPGQDRPTNPP